MDIALSIVQPIIDLSLKINKVVETFRYNREDCRKISEVVTRVRTVAEGLQKTTEEEDGGALVVDALMALKHALERSWVLVVALQRKNAVLRALDADEKLRRVYLDISLNLSAVVFANGAYNTSKLADINAIIVALRADVAFNTWMLVKILEIVAALPDAFQDLRQQVARLVQSYSDLTDHDASYYQNETTREAKKTDGVASTRETKKTDDDVARYPTEYSSRYAYLPSNQAQNLVVHQNESKRETETKKIETKKTAGIVCCPFGTIGGGGGGGYFVSRGGGG